MHLFIDSNVFINGFVFSDSNSSIILEYIKNRKIYPITSEKVITEVETVLLRIATQDIIKTAKIFLKTYCPIIPQKEVIQTMNQLRGQIKEKDLEQLAVVKQFKISRLISYDRDFELFPEYRTPKQFVIEMGLKPFETEY